MRHEIFLNNQHVAYKLLKNKTLMVPISNPITLKPNRSDTDRDVTNSTVDPI